MAPTTTSLRSNPNKSLRHSVNGNMKKKKLVLTFQPEQRRKYLTSFSSEKQKRRAFGLAMQKVKDRNTRLQERKEGRLARLNQICELERNKDLLNDNDNNYATPAEDVVSETKKASNSETTVLFRDDETRAQFGGEVIVTTTFVDMSSSNQQDDYSTAKSKKEKRGDGVDKEQVYASKVDKYLPHCKKHLKKKAHRAILKKGGKHGAEGMKGMGNARDLKFAQKVLSVQRAKNVVTHVGAKGGRGRKR